MTELLIYNIYKIINNFDDKVYIGSTRQKLSARMGGHRTDSKTSPKKISKYMRDNGVKNFKIKLIKIIHVKNRRIANLIEQIEIWKIPLENRLNTIRSHIPSIYYRGNIEGKRKNRRDHYA